MVAGYDGLGNQGKAVVEFIACIAETITIYILLSKVRRQGAVVEPIGDTVEI